MFVHALTEAIETRHKSELIVRLKKEIFIQLKLIIIPLRNQIVPVASPFDTKM